MKLSSLQPAVISAHTESAQRFLASAYDSVNHVFETLDTVRGIRKSLKGTVKGRTPANEEDLLRAAIVFTGAGLDAALKQLVLDSLPVLLAQDRPLAHEKFEEFLKKKLERDGSVDATTLVRYLSSEKPRQKMIDDYVYFLTGSSLQSVQEVRRVVSALGFGEKELHREIGGLKDLFIARNQVSHELDLQRPETQGDRSRRTRTISGTQSLCHTGLKVGQMIINDTAELLNALEAH